jgi:hypothetical protein
VVFASEQSFLPTIAKYIVPKQTKSVSRTPELIDRGFLVIKKLINSSVYLFQKTLVSVKYRYFLGQKQLDVLRQNYLEKLERVVGARGRPLVDGMLFGNLSGISQEVYHSFKVIGILHILSASSANFTFFMQFFLFFLQPSVAT